MGRGIGGIVDCERPCEVKTKDSLPCVFVTDDSPELGSCVCMCVFIATTAIVAIKICKKVEQM